MIGTKPSAFDFFFEQAGYSYDPAKESEFAGRTRCATELARAEYLAWDQGYIFDWVVDDVDSSEWSDEQPPYAQWCCLMRETQFGAVVQTLGCIDFGRDVEPWGQPYKRVVEAELAMEELL